MNEKFDEFGNRIEFTPADSENADIESVEALEETIEQFESEAQKQFNRARFEAKATESGKRLGHGVRSVLEFAGDSVGLIILKNGGRRDAAYKLLKGSRKVGKMAETIVNSAVRQGGKLLGATAEQVDVDYLKERAEEVKEDVTRKVKQSDVLEKIEPDHVRAKAKDLYQNVTAKVQEGKEKLFKPDDPEEARLKQEELERKIEAFEKLYEDEAREKLHSEEGYKPEEFKETKPS